MKLCRTLLSSVFGFHNFAPCLPCRAGVPCCSHEQHREKEVTPSDFGISEFLSQDLVPVAEELDSDGTARVPLAVHKLLERWEMRSNKDALDAVTTSALEQAGDVAGQMESGAQQNSFFLTAGEGEEGGQ